MKTKKRIWLITAVITVFIMSLFGVTVSASAENEVSLSSDDVSSVWGMDFTTEIKATKISSTEASFTLKYDSELVVLKECSAANGVTVSVEANVLNVTVSSLPEDETTVLTLVFIASSELASTEYEYITLENSGAITAEFGKLNICEIGDVNMDGKVNSRDVLMIKQSAVRMITLNEAQSILANAFADDSVNSRDAVAITQSIVKMPVTLGNRVDIVFKDSSGSVVTKRAVVKGSALRSVPLLPEDYGWSLSETGYAEVDFSEINEDISVMVKSILEYAIEVIFLDYDGTVIYSEFIEQGSDFINVPSYPTRNNYECIGWSTTSFESITEDLTVTAQYVRTYDVKFVDYNGSVIKTETVRLNSSAEAPTAPNREGYDFTGWDIEFDNIESDLTVTATYEIKRYTVTFLGVDGNVVSKVENVKHGYPVTAPEVPEVYCVFEKGTGYEFTGWDNQLDAVTSHMTVKALYEKQITEPIIAVESVTIQPKDEIVQVKICLFTQKMPYGISLDVNFDNALQAAQSATAEVNSQIMENKEEISGCTSKLTAEGMYELRWIDAGDTGLTADTIVTFTFHLNTSKGDRTEYAINILESTYIIDQNMDKITPVIISGDVSINW